MHHVVHHQACIFSPISSETVDVNQQPKTTGKGSVQIVEATSEIKQRTLPSVENVAAVVDDGDDADHDYENTGAKKIVSTESMENIRRITTKNIDITKHVEEDNRTRNCEKEKEGEEEAKTTDSQKEKEKEEVLRRRKTDNYDQRGKKTLRQRMSRLQLFRHNTETAAGGCGSLSSTTNAIDRPEGRDGQGKGFGQVGQVGKGQIEKSIVSEMKGGKEKNRDTAR